ncbi:MFS general substrate transporter [Aspergillus neoniger CBS 115656]|uniref:MFS general substrate transporter n=1 Tax=Aspergillus neoniger (strain CBS 115656) TaxID=1448310 RepID=A0A318YTK8_ASPNB|nr:MFS general substrate transporter [Aspergillus neoniger CBS 115656]PYH31278.1 MFS general substrate transporter [Aspergillus neoniger CBS 115656]
MSQEVKDKGPQEVVHTIELGSLGGNSSSASLQPLSQTPSEAAPPPPPPPHTLLTERKKIMTIAIAAIVGFLAPVSANIYYPAIDQLSEDLHVSVSKINLTITTYMIFQGVAPLVTGSISDVYGRRPTMLVCLITYLAVNIGLALQDNYIALIVLRTFQSCGSSAISVVGIAVTADLVTRSERGKYMIYSSLGTTMGPALGPIIGGVLAQFLRWRSIFWFLAIFALAMIILILVCFPETCRMVVGNGSIPAPRWNRPLIPIVQPSAYEGAEAAKKELEDGPKPRRPTPIDSIKIALEKETGAIIAFCSILYCGYFAVLSSLSSELGEKYGYNSLQIGLCYIPYGIGSLTSRWTVGRFVDWNFRRLGRQHGMEVVNNRQVDLIEFPVEKARLQITLPMVYMSCICIIGYGWVMNYRTHVAGPLIMLFFTAHTIAGATSTLVTLLIDCHVKRAATVTASNTMFRCFLGAGAVAAAVPIINAIGMGWMGTLIAVLWAVSSVLLWGVLLWGHDYRKKRAGRI